MGSEYFGKWVDDLDDEVQGPPRGRRPSQPRAGRGPTEEAQEAAARKRQLEELWESLEPPSATKTLEDEKLKEEQRNFADELLYAIERQRQKALVRRTAKHVSPPARPFMHLADQIMANVIEPTTGPIGSARRQIHRELDTPGSPDNVGAWKEAHIPKTLEELYRAREKFRGRGEKEASTPAGDE